VAISISVIFSLSLIHTRLDHVELQLQGKEAGS
jgi:hypothetical protein